MHKKFNHTEIEKKWQELWKESGIYNVGNRDTQKEKEFVLVEWPYPSGNLHVGHWFAFGVVDMYVRARRMQGKQVLFPIGFDAFGLPAENAAMKHGLDPKSWTEKNISYMKTQLESMGNAFSWDKTTSSTDPEYYAWTQWMFTEFFKNDIAYRGVGVVNWCPGCNTVIANEQVLSDGTCERSGDAIEKKQMPQWMLRITKYADRLIDDLEGLDWHEHIKEAQRQWIGRSSGAQLSFSLSNGDAIDVFTTRPDTLYGVTYLVLAPEHPSIAEMLIHENSPLTNGAEVQEYIKIAREKSDIERTNATKEKTGVKLEGIHAINGATNEEIPVYIADYVLAGYGTGAIMAVPAHDERDFAFAKKYGIEIRSVINQSFGSTGVYEDFENVLPYSKQEGVLENSGEFNGMSISEAGIAITQKVGGKMTNTYRLRDWSIGRQRYWGVPIPIVYDPEGNAHPIPKEHLPWHLPTDVDFKPTGTPPLAKSHELKDRVEAIFGKGWTPEVETMDTFVDSSWYFLRYIDGVNTKSFSSREAQDAWMPIDIYFGGSEHTTMHLLYSRFWQKALFDLGLVSVSEPYKKRVNRALVLGTDGNKMSKSKGNVIDPDEQVRHLGADTVRMYLAFMGPYDEATSYPWDIGGIAGIRRFLERVYGLGEHIRDTESEETARLLHKTIAKVTKDISSYKFNTSISALMIFINHAEKEGLTKDSYETFLKLLAPFAPHLTEELWQAGKMSGVSIHTSPWPEASAELMNEDSVKIGVQIDGKMRGTVTVPFDAPEDVVVEMVKGDAVLGSKLPTEDFRVIFIKNKIINFARTAKG